MQAGLREVLGYLLPVDLVEAGELRDGVMRLELLGPLAPVPGREPCLDLRQGGSADPAAHAEDMHQVVLGVVEDRVMRIPVARAVLRVGDYLAEGPALIVRGRRFMCGLSHLTFSRSWPLGSRCRRLRRRYSQVMIRVAVKMNVAATTPTARNRYHRAVAKCANPPGSARASSDGTKIARMHRS